MRVCHPAFYSVFLAPEPVSAAIFQNLFKEHPMPHEKLYLDTVLSISKFFSAMGTGIKQRTNLAGLAQTGSLTHQN